MNRSTCGLLTPILSCIYLSAGCGGGPAAPTNPSPTSNPTPAIISVTPSSAVAGSPGTPVTITGSGFIAASSAQWNGAPIPTTFGSATSLTLTLTASNLANGTVAKLTVVNPSPGGGTSAPVDFSVNNPVPAVTKINPASVLAGSGNSLLDITGSGFVPSTVMTWSGAALTTAFVSATEVKATVPAADLAASSATMIAAQNPAPGGGTSPVTTFNVNSPVAVITSISPRTVPPGSATTITITGTGFEANSVVCWNGAARPTTVISATVLQVVLSAADLQNQGIGSLTVNNPGPAGSTSSASPLTVTTQPIPVIQSVSITSGPGQSVPCPQLMVAIAGQNFASNSTIQANGISLPVFTYLGILTSIVDYLPSGFVSPPGGLSFTVTNPGGVPATSDPFAYPATSPPVLALCATPSPATVYAGGSFSLTVQPTDVNVSGNATLTLGTLPAGITTASTNVPLPPTGVTLHLQAANSTATGTYDLALTGTAGTSSAKGDFNFTVSTSAPPSFFFVSPISTEVGVPMGGSGSIRYKTSVDSTSADFDVTPSVTGLPPGTTATFSPAVFSAGQSVTVTLAAAVNAPVTQNASITLTGTPSVQVASATTHFLADVTQPPGSLPGSRTDFVLTAATPYAAAYDVTHNLIFSSNPDWNRVDVISNATHKIVKSIPVRAPRGLDITQDNSHVWVQTGSPNIYEIDTTSLQANHYSLPNQSIGSSGLPVSFSTDRLLALSGGTLFLCFNDSGGGGGAQAGVWNPQTNQLTVLTSGLITGFGLPVRSGDGTHVYAANETNATGIAAYSVGSQSLTTIGSGTAYSAVEAVNADGSKLVLSTSSGGLALYNSSMSLLGTVPGAVEPFEPLSGGILFSADNTRLYEVGVYDGLGLVLTIDASSLKVLGTAPAAPTDPVGTSGYAGTATPFAIDATGMVLGLQNFRHFL